MLTDDLPWVYQDIPDLDHQNELPNNIISADVYRKHPPKGMLIIPRQQKVHDILVNKQFSNTIYLTFPYPRVMEEEEVEVEEDSLGYLLVTEIII